jgi:hypothetical protein
MLKESPYDKDGKIKNIEHDSELMEDPNSLFKQFKEQEK